MNESKTIKFVINRPWLNEDSPSTPVPTIEKRIGLR
jgi:hypothetical protein